jgi:hypothetical protein
MTDRQALHELIDKLPEAGLDRFRSLLENACEPKNGNQELPGTPTDFESLHKMADELYRDVPQEEWDRLPDDLMDQLDHYVYGVPKRKLE